MSLAKIVALVIMIKPMLISWAGVSEALAAPAMLEEVMIVVNKFKIGWPLEWL